MSDTGQAVEESSVREWTETAVYILTSVIAAYALLHQAGVEIDFTPVTSRVKRARARVARTPWLNPKEWRRMVTEVLLEAWNIVEREEP